MTLQPGKLILAATPTWNPTFIETALWLDAADASTVTLNGSTVSQWNDKSGNGRHLAQATATDQPAYISSGLNGKNVIRLDAGDSLSNEVVNLPVGSSARTMYAVYTPRLRAGVNDILAQGVLLQQGRWFRLEFRSSPPGDPYFAGYIQDLTDSTAPTLTTKIGGITYDGTTGTLYRDGSQIAQSTLALNTDGNRLFIRMIGDIAEAVFVSQSLTVTERQKLEGYLAHKWGLTANLPADHPYKTVEPTP
jgi:hypothetical protein